MIPSTSLSTASHTTMPTTTVAHTWTIDNFTFQVSFFENLSSKEWQEKQSLKSATFPKEDIGVKFQLELFPNGHVREARGHVGIFIHFIEAGKSGSVLAKCNISLLNQKYKPKHSKNLKNTITFGGKCGFDSYISLSSLRHRSDSLLSGDQLIVHCEITFMGRLSETSAKKKKKKKETIETVLPILKLTEEETAKETPAVAAPTETEEQLHEQTYTSKSSSEGLVLFDLWE